MSSKKSKKPKKTDEAADHSAESVNDTTAGSVEDESADKDMSPEDALAAARQEAQEATDRYLRAKAEIENVRKRGQRDLAEAREYTKSVTVGEFFSPFDHFQMAMAHVEESPDVATMKQGMNMILSEFQRGFENLGITLVDAVGKEFNPAEHEAVAQEASDTVPEGHVLRQWKCGYKMGDKLLRPAAVVVSSGPAGDGETADEKE
ncbi:MAG: nucleotide exchange factor GrpE [Lentisphaeria bacterium]|nr:nucleotide exchange factor GrpE [Lentisphaeria bacterium]